MKLFIVVVVSVIVCCNAQDDSLRAVQLLEAILNETKATRQLQNELLEDIRNETRATRELQYQNLQKNYAQENALNELIDKVESVYAQLAILINETQNIRLGQNTCCNITNDSLGHIYNELHSTRQEAQDCCEVAQEWYTQPNVFVAFASCEDIKTMSSSAPSGYYTITKYNGTTQRVYCDMEHFCGSEISGWTRVAYLDMSDSQRCPNELSLYNVDGVRACGRRFSLVGSCDNVTFSTNGTSYSQVCGRVIGYQFGTTDSIRSHQSIDDPYVEGVSITHGSPRQHIWTFISGNSESGASSSHCPCNNGITASVPSFVGDCYFCESGAPSRPSYQLYIDDPLWDGEKCGGDEGPCCNVPGIPWFYKDLKQCTTDDIELRVCADQSTRFDDTPVGLYEIYVKN